MRLLILNLFLIAGLVSFGKEERYTSRMNGIDYNSSGTPVEIEDDKFYESIAGSSNFTVADVNCFVKLGLEEGITGMYQDNFNITVNFTVTAYTSPTTTVSLGNIPLQISYHPGAIGQNVYLASKRINGYHKLKIEIASIYDNIGLAPIADLPINSFMELELVVDRYYTLNESAALATVFDLDHEVLASTNELSFYWDYISGAEFYELEWVHVNNYNDDGSSKAAGSVAFTEQEFRFNSTRIRTTSEHYEIPLIFDKGFIVYRLRPVGICDNDDADNIINNEVFGKWTTWTINSGTTLDTRSDVADFTHYFEVTTEHEATINWQYQAIYAEDGKKKDIVSYYDGTLRNRQTATKLSSNEKVIVGETIYDSEGRPAVTILPVPTVTGPAATADALGFHPAFNQNSGNLAYSLYDFDVDASSSACGVTLPGALNDEGAGLYYGNNIAETGNWQDQVPDAGGYPFVQVEYMPDNSGRIKRQSGVGDDYTIEGSHATRYFYTQPYQEELDRLFGTNAGYKSRYKKNIVIDANGQVSVSYIDPFGRVIATALVGAEPTNMIALANEGGYALSNPGNTILVDLLAKTTAAAPDTPNDQNHRFSTGNFGSTMDGLKFSTEQIVYQTNSDLKYKYTLEADRFEINCGVSTFDYPYVFNLSIGLRDACGTDVYVDEVNNLQIGTTADVGGQSESIDAIASTDGIWGDNLPIGTYTNYKILTVNEDAAKELADQYIADGQTAGCVKTLADFENTFQGQIDFSGCGMTCQSCITSLGADADDYIIERKLDYDWINLTTTEQEDLTEQFESEYAVLVEECNELCGTGISYCETVREQMLMDVSPHGQYGAVSGDMSLSVFNTSHILPGTTVDWQNPASPYINSDGVLAKIYVTFTGGSWNIDFTGGTLVEPGTSNLFVFPQQLTNLSDFVVAWDPNWAESLLDAHPESCYLGWCSDTGEFGYTETINGTAYTSEEIDNILLSIGTFDEAANVTELGGANLTNLSTLIALDPFFGNTSSFIIGSPATIANNFYTFSDGTTILDLWEFAVFMVNEGDNFGVEPSPLPGSTTVDASNEDEVWNTFKMLYISLKQHFYKTWAHRYAVDAGCYNGCIGNDAFDPNQYGFATANSTTGLGGVDPGNILDDALPCALQNADEFSDKTPRFFGVNEAMSDQFGDTPEEMVENINLGIYNETAMCPLAFDLVSLLNGLATENNVVVSSPLTLNGKPYFGIQLYAGLGGPIDSDFSFGSSTVEDIDYATVTSGTNNEILEISLENSVPDNACQSIELELHQYGSVTPGDLSWSDYGPGNDWIISSFHSFFYVDQSPAGTYNFQIVAVVEDLVTPANGPYEVLIEGSTCLMVGQCIVDGETNSPVAGTIGALQIPCTPLPEAYAMIQMFNYMLFDTSTTKYFFNDTYLPASDVDVLLDGNIFLNWNTSGNHMWEIASSGTQRTITITEVSSGDAYTIVIDDVPANVQSFVEIITYEAPDFKVKMLLEDGTYAYSDATIVYTPDGWDPGDVALGSCGVCSGEEQQLTQAVDEFIQNLLEDEDAAAIPLDVLKYLGLEQYAGTIAVVGPVVTGKQLSYGFDIDVDSEDDNVGTFIIYPTDETTDLQSITISSYTPLRLHGSNGPHYARKEILKSDDEYVEIEIITPVPVADCPCTDQINPPLTCADAYTLYLAGLPSGVNAIGSQAEFCALNFEDYVTSFIDLMTNAVSAGYTAASINQHIGTVYEGNTGIDPFTVYVYTLENPPTSFYTYADYVADVTNDGLLPISQEEFENLANCPQCKRMYQNYLGNEGTATINIDEFCGTFPSSCQENIAGNFDGWGDYTWEYENDCEEQLINSANLNAIEAYDTYIEMVKQEFIVNYINSALENVVETFELEAPDNEYHYTLYYYDQAGNLVRTVPPGGVNKIAPANWDDVKVERAAGPSSATYLDYNTEHGYMTTYGYNALNQLVIQRTPDGGVSRFWYDALGRLVASQNAQQNFDGKFSYTRFDELGRIVEVGELTADAGQLDVNGLPNYPETIFNDDTYPANFAASSGTARTQITKTYYDESLLTLGGNEMNGRNRIGSVTYSEYYTIDEDEYQSAYHYQYDIHGNVSKMVQEIRREPTIAESGLTSTVEYTYDLVSGNVLEVAYNDGRVDQFYHRYEYDADNRITRAFTSEDGVNFVSDAKYFYYDHGPLARTEIGNDKVQGQDYAYTSQGWLKSVNGVKLDAETIDMGQDAFVNASNLNGFAATDAFGFALTYYDGDYVSRTIGGDDFMGDLSAVSPINDLFNGNIAQMATAQMNETEALEELVVNNYEYDQLNRIKHMESYLSPTTVVPGTYNYTNATSGSYESEYTYDHNGNILYLKRWNQGGTLMDNLTYHYYQSNMTTTQQSGGIFSNNVDMTNKLAYVDDGAGVVNTVDLGAQLAGNYEYNLIGQLDHDEEEEIELIEWTVTGKVKKITRTSGSTKADLEFIYDPMGNRICKIVKPRTGGSPTNEEAWEFSYYTYDAGGNPMAIYGKTAVLDVDELTETYTLAEQNIFGSSRVGVVQRGEAVATRVSTADDTGGMYDANGYFNDITVSTLNMDYEADPSDEDFEVIAGRRMYELSNHLGNVLEVVSDQKIVVSEAVSHMCFDGTNQYAKSLSNYNAGLGANMTIETWVKTSDLGTFAIAAQYNGTSDKGGALFVSNGKCKFDGRNGNSTYYTSGAGTTDIADGNWHHVVGTCENGVWKVYVDGQLESTSSTSVPGTFTGLSAPFFIGATMYGGYMKGCIKEVSFWDYAKSDGEIATDFSNYFGYTGSETGLKGYWKMDEGSGTALYESVTAAPDLAAQNGPSWTSDDLIAGYSPDVIQWSDYYPFGMQLPDRHFEPTNDYRHSFNGMENVEEITDTKSHLDFGARIYDSRVGRWLSIDPHASSYPSVAPYVFALNNPIFLMDPDGKDPKPPVRYKYVVETTIITRLDEYGNTVWAETGQTWTNPHSTEAVPPTYIHGVTYKEGNDPNSNVVWYKVTYVQIMDDQGQTQTSSHSYSENYSEKGLVKDAEVINGEFEDKKMTKKELNSFKKDIVSQIEVIEASGGSVSNVHILFIGDNEAYTDEEANAVAKEVEDYVNKKVGVKVTIFGMSGQQSEASATISYEKEGIIVSPENEQKLKEYESKVGTTEAIEVK